MKTQNQKHTNPMKVITGKDTRWSYCNVWEAKAINGGTPKYAAIRRERREAERAAAAEPIVETPALTTEAKPSAVAPEKEVAVNE